MDRKQVYDIAVDLVVGGLNKHITDDKRKIKLNLKSRKRETVLAKKMISFLCMKESKLTVPFTYEYLGSLLKVDHSTVIHYIKKTHLEIQFPEYIEFYNIVKGKFLDALGNNDILLRMKLKERNELNKEILVLMNEMRKRIG